MDYREDLTQKERVESGLLRELIGLDCACNDDPTPMPLPAHSCPSGQARAELLDDGNGDGCGRCEQICTRSHVCGFGVEDGILAAVYVPLQQFAGVYDQDTAFRRGTMFEGLDKPFYGDGEVNCRGEQR